MLILFSVSWLMGNCISWSVTNELSNLTSILFVFNDRSLRCTDDLSLRVLCLCSSFWSIWTSYWKRELTLIRILMIFSLSELLNITPIVCLLYRSSFTISHVFGIKILVINDDLSRSGCGWAGGHYESIRRFVDDMIYSMWKCPRCSISPPSWVSKNWRLTSALNSRLARTLLYLL